MSTGFVDSGPLIFVSGLHKTYRGSKRKALDNVSLFINEGECFGLIGPNGAGKTTLMSCLLALVKPDLGIVTIGGVSPDDLAVREVTGFMPERPNFEGWLTARDFLKMHHMLARRPSSTRKADIEEALNRVGLEPSNWNRIIRTFSRGMLQRLGLAQALIGRPRILFLDEPGSGMDPPGNALLRQLFAQFKRDGITVVLNSHHLDEMEKVCDRVGFIRAGKIEAVESLAEVALRPYVLRVRWLDHNILDSDTLARCAAEANVQLITSAPNSGRFSVRNSEAAANLIEKLVHANYRIESAQPEQTTLERLFAEIEKVDGEVDTNND